MKIIKITRSEIKETERELRVNELESNIEQALVDYERIKVQLDEAHLEVAAAYEELVEYLFESNSILNDHVKIWKNIQSKTAGRLSNFTKRKPDKLVRTSNGSKLAEYEIRDLEETPGAFTTFELEDDERIDRGNLMRTKHAYHKNDDIGYRATFSKDLENKFGDTIVSKNDVYVFPNLKAVEDFYIKNGLKPLGWRANNISTAMSQRTGYHAGALWKYIDLSNLNDF